MKEGDQMAVSLDEVVSMSPAGVMIPVGLIIIAGSRRISLTTAERILRVNIVLTYFNSKATL